MSLLERAMTAIQGRRLPITTVVDRLIECKGCPWYDCKENLCACLTGKGVPEEQAHLLDYNQHVGYLSKPENECPIHRWPAVEMPTS